MKKVLLALIVAAIFAAPNAHAVFEGVLKAGAQTTITLTSAGNTTAATVLAARRSRLVALGTLTAPPFGAAQLALRSMPKVDRVIITVDLPPQGSGTLHVVQGTIDDQFAVGGDTDFVYNVTP